MIFIYLFIKKNWLFDRVDRFRVRTTGLRVEWWTKFRQVGQPEVHRLNQDRGLGLGVVKPLTHIASPKEYVFFFFDFLVVLKMKANNWVFCFISLVLLTTTVHCFTKNNKEYRICFWFFFFFVVQMKSVKIHQFLFWFCFLLRYSEQQNGNALGFVLLFLSETVGGFLWRWQLRRERIAERMKALQELVPNANKVILTKPIKLLYFLLINN